VEHAKGVRVADKPHDDRPQQEVPDDPDHEEEHNTQGTMVLMLFFLIIIIGVWGTMFLLLLERG
jgi:uncharacterized ion transporter superfamily protein YfcC